MSLFRQIWLVIILTTSVLLVGFLYVGVIIAIDVLKSEQAQKNVDLGKYLSLQTQKLFDLDEEQFRAAVISLGKSPEIEYLKFVDTRSTPNKIIFEKKNNSQFDSVPALFVEMFPINTPPARVNVVNGGKAFGVIEVSKSKTSLYEALWSAIELMVVWMIGGMFLIGIFCNHVLHKLRKPIDTVIAQAQALSRREFIQIPISKVPELKPVTVAMNEMVSRIKNMFENEAKRLDNFNRDANVDKLTGLGSREFFMGKLNDMLVREDAPANGVLVILRLVGLNEANTKIGRDAVDTIIKKVGSLFTQIAKQVEGGVTGRPKGIEFSLLLPSYNNIDELMATIVKYTNAILDVVLPESEKNSNLVQLCLGGSKYNKSDNKSQLLARLDNALANSEVHNGKKWFEAKTEDKNLSLVSQNDWVNWFQKVINNNEIQLGQFPVKNSLGKIMHFESPIRLNSPDGKEWLSAGVFMPMAQRLKITPIIDLAAINLAIEKLNKNPDLKLAVNVAGQSIADARFKTQINKTLIEAKNVCSRLFIEISEIDINRDIESFRKLCINAKSNGVKVGIKHIGQNFAVVAKMQDLALNYIKLDGQFSHQINNSESNKEFIAGVCSLVHGIGILVVAVGVANNEEANTLFNIKVDAITGPAVSI